MFLHLSVIPSVHNGWGVYPSACWDTPPEQTSPWADTTLRQTPPGQTPPWADTPRYTVYWNAFLLLLYFILVNTHDVSSRSLKNSLHKLCG